MKKLALIIASIICAAIGFTLIACGDEQPKQKYTVSFDTLGGSPVAAIGVEVGAAIPRPSAVPTKEMATFDDWYVTPAANAQKFIFGSRMPSHNITIYAKWIGDVSVRIDFDANGGEFNTEGEHFSIGIVGAGFVEPEFEPTRYGYRFAGWYSDKEGYNEYTFSTYPVENATLYAGWDRVNAEFSYVSYYVNGELNSIKPFKKTEQVTPLTVEQGVTYSDWYIGPDMRDRYTFGAATANISLYASCATQGLEISTAGVVTGYSGSQTDIVIPNYNNGVAVTSIGANAFIAPNVRITSVWAPKSITSIGNNAFYNCQYLASVRLTGSVKTIGNNAFYRNERLKSLGDISAVTSIGTAAFIGCKSLVDIVLPQTLTAIGAQAFADCTSLRQIVIPSGVTSISADAFSGCIALRSAVISSTELTSIGGAAFKNCAALTSVTIERSSVVAAIAADSFSGCPYVKIYVPQSILDSYKTGADYDAIKDRFSAIKVD